VSKAASNVSITSGLSKTKRSPRGGCCTPKQYDDALSSPDGGQLRTPLRRSPTSTRRQQSSHQCLPRLLHDVVVRQHEPRQRESAYSLSRAQPPVRTAPPTTASQPTHLAQQPSRSTKAQLKIINQNTQRLVLTVCASAKISSDLANV
jgi:hypothetical protein